MGLISKYRDGTAAVAATPLARSRTLAETVGHHWCMLLYWTHYWLWDRRFERNEQVATSGTVHREHLEPVSTAHADLSYEYGASPRLVVNWILDGLNIDLSKFSFIDYGSGRGRVLLTAAKRPFRSVRGIEFCSVLHEQAERNISGCAEKDIACRDVKSVFSDVLDYDLPDGDCILYFFNPFEAELLDRVVRKYTDSTKCGRDRVIIVYYNAKHDRTLMENKHVRVRRLSLWARLRLKLLSPHPVQVYEIVG